MKFKVWCKHRWWDQRSFWVWAQPMGDDVTMWYGLSQWETTLHCNVVSHWLSSCPYGTGPRLCATNRPANVMVMFADVLAPNRCQAINKKLLTCLWLNLVICIIFQNVANKLWPTGCQQCWAFMFSLKFDRTSCWINSRIDDAWRRHAAHIWLKHWTFPSLAPCLGSPSSYRILRTENHVHCSDVTYHRQLANVFNSLLKLKLKKHQESALLVLCQGISTVDSLTKGQ